MPELPEVETIRSQLAPRLEGRTLVRVEILDPRLTRPHDLFEVAEELEGDTVASVERHGKYLLALLDDGARLVMHLGMTGQLFAAGASSPRLLSATARASLAPEQQVQFRPDAHTHLRFEFADGGPEVYFRDTRKFGKVLWLAGGQAHPRLDRLGIDALHVDGKLLFTATRGRRTGTDQRTKPARRNLSLPSLNSVCWIVKRAPRRGSGLQAAVPVAAVRPMPRSRVRAVAAKVSRASDPEKLQRSFIRQSAPAEPVPMVLASARSRSIRSMPRLPESTRSGFHLQPAWPFTVSRRVASSFAWLGRMFGMFGSRPSQGGDASNFVQGCVASKRL